MRSVPSVLNASVAAAQARSTWTDDDASCRPPSKAAKPSAIIDGPLSKVSSTESSPLARASRGNGRLGPGEVSWSYGALATRYTGSTFNIGSADGCREEKNRRRASGSFANASSLSLASNSAFTAGSLSSSRAYDSDR